MSEIDELIERVEKAIGPDRELDLAIDKISPNYSGRLAYYTRSIDAALALMLRKLPGSMWCVGNMEDGPFCRLLWPDAKGGYSNYLTANAATECLSINLATLRSIRQSEGSNG